MTEGSRVRWAAAALAASLMLGTVMAADAAPVRATDSRMNGMTVSGTQAVGTFNGVPYVRTYGVVRGVIGEGEDLIGFAELPKNAQGRYEYASEFEIIAPAPGQARTKLSSSIPRIAAVP